MKGLVALIWLEADVYFQDKMQCFSGVFNITMICCGGSFSEPSSNPLVKTVANNNVHNSSFLNRHVSDD